ncbi:MAG: guanylate kinase [Candidatus Kryptoniota bacterium]
MKKGLLIVVSAPSGAGKTTIVKEILKQFPDFQFSVSATTRARRPGEVDGREYFFLTREEFEKKIASGELVEYEEIYGNYYGTLKSEVERALRQNSVMVFDVDVKGALSIKSKFPQALLIFIQPPSLEELRKRLLLRKSETEEQIEKRMARVPMELEKSDLFDYIILNDDLKKAVNEVIEIIKRKLQEC